MQEFLSGAISGTVQTIVGHPFDTIKTRIQNQNKISFCIRNLYRGVTYPLLSSAIINAGIFGITETCYHHTNNYFVSGFISGVLMTPVITPFELLKVQKQNRYTGNINIFRGIIPTVIRESIGASVYFGTYFIFRNEYNILLSGGLAGFFSWLLTYPIDSVKTRIQSSDTMTIKEAINKGNLWRGFGTCSVRCIIVNALGFYVYERVKTCLRQN